VLTIAADEVDEGYAADSPQDRIARGLRSKSPVLPIG
jgi:hypothetical protein